MTPPPTESIHSAPRPAALRERNCDFCGRRVHQAMSIERVEKTVDAPEVVALCVECALGVD
jgi:hypothetical protein